MKKRKNYNKWVHFRHHEFDLDIPGFAEDSPTTICGKTALRMISTSDKNKVTCPRCLEKLKDENWFCPEHGFIKDEFVTFEETCSECGINVCVESGSAYI